MRRRKESDPSKPGAGSSDQQKRGVKKHGHASRDSTHNGRRVAYPQPNIALSASRTVIDQTPPNPRPSFTKPYTHIQSYTLQVERNRTTATNSAGVNKIETKTKTKKEKYGGGAGGGETVFCLNRPRGTHLVAHGGVRARPAHACPTPPAVVPAEDDVESAGAHHAPRHHRVRHPELLVVHLPSERETARETGREGGTQRPKEINVVPQPTRPAPDTQRSQVPYASTTIVWASAFDQQRRYRSRRRHTDRAGRERARI